MIYRNRNRGKLGAWLGVAALLCAMPNVAVAGEIGPDTAPGMSSLSGASLTCVPDPFYMKIVGTQKVLDTAKWNSCRQCQQAVDAQKSKMDAAWNAAVAENTGIVGANAISNSAISNASNGQQKNSEQSAHKVQTTSDASQQQRAALAKRLAANAQACSAELQSACSGQMAPDDQSAYNQAKQGCEQVASAAEANAAEKLASGGMMDGLGQMAGKLGEALGQMMGGGAGGGAAPGSPYTDTYKPTIDPLPSTNIAGNGAGSTVKLDSITAKGTSIDPADTGTASTDGAGAYAGYSPSTGGLSSESGLDLAGNGGASKHGGAVKVSMANGAGGTGASKMAGKEELAKGAAAAGAGANYEIPSAGGGSKSSFLGLKSKAYEEEAAGETGVGVLGDLGVDGERGLASLQESPGVRAENEGSLFVVIRSKYAEIKKRGNI